MDIQLLAPPTSEAWQTAVPDSLRTQPRPIGRPETGGKKALIARALAAAAVTGHLGRRFCPPNRDVRIPAYHAVWGLSADRSFTYDAELVSATPDEFAWQMAYVRQHFNPITFRQFLSALDGREPMPARPVIVTF